MDKSLFLIGMPGAGKSHWGKIIADRWQVPFIDLDEEIEHSEQRTISKIFEADGEPYFRTQEGIVLSRIVDTMQKPFVLSTGGGTPINEANFQLMKEHGIIVYLKATPQLLLANLQGETDKRPLLTIDEKMVKILQDLLAKREQTYLMADYIFEVDGLAFSTFEPLIKHSS